MLCLLVGAAQVVGAQGQAIDGIIEGVVRAQTDSAVISGASVRAFNSGTGYERSVLSDQAGRYSMPLMPPGEYVVFVEAKSYATISHTGLILRAGQTLTVEFAVPQTGFSESVQVTSDPSPVEVGRTVQSNTYEERTVRAIPTIGRSILDFFVLQPGVNAPPISSGGSGTGTPSTVYGGLGLRQMNVDGVSNNLQGGARNLVISQEAVQEFQTVTNHSAEFGRVAGGIQNALTRSGSNQMRGSAYLFTRQTWLSERPYLLAATAPTPEFERYNYGATAGGPVARDRSFYFVSYERWSQDLPVVSTMTPGNAERLGIPPSSIGAWTTTFRAHTLTARNDTQLNAQNRFSFRYNYYHDRESPLNGGLIAREVSTRFDENPFSYTAQLVSVVTPTLVNEARFLYATRSIENGVAADPDAPNIDISGVGSFNGNANGIRRTRERGIHFVDNLTLTKGRHVIKAGFDLLPVSFRERTTNINGSFVFGGLAAAAGVRGAVSALDQFLLTQQGATDPAAGRPYWYSRFTQSIGAEYFEASTFNHGYFVQDDFRVNDRLKVNVGLRYEYFGTSRRQSESRSSAHGDVPDRWQQLGATPWRRLRSHRPWTHGLPRWSRPLLQRRRRTDLQQLPARQRSRRDQRQRHAHNRWRAAVLTDEGSAADRRHGGLRRATDGRGLRRCPGHELVHDLRSAGCARPGLLGDVPGEPRAEPAALAQRQPRAYGHLARRPDAGTRPAIAQTRATATSSSRHRLASRPITAWWQL